ncbi:GIY-YIG catalytic domain-containing protein, partial [Rhizodiscina lignyota]
MNRPIPAFYCCYQLRSTVKHAALYIGSTPNPRRRRKQHNGLTVGGAKKTSWEKFRPWDMVCLVTGFPSKIAALQFEWAWQNPHNSRHIPDSERITHPRVVTKTRKGGKKYTARLRPPMSLKCRLSNLHLLLRMRSFERWPLNLHFFSEDVFKVWTRWDEQCPASIRKGIKVSLVIPANTQGLSVGVESIDVTYLPMRDQLKRSRDALVGGIHHECSVCREEVQPNEDLAILCSSESCEAVSHLGCLSGHFLMQAGQDGAVLPTTGQCKSCGTTLQWIDLMKDLSLRTRGQHVLD